MTTPKPPEVKLEVKTDSQVVHATITYINNSSGDAYVEIIKGCLDGHIKSNVFEISSGDQEIDYIGMMAKRRPPGPDDFVKLAPHEQLQTTVRLDEAYEFLPGQHDYQALYSAFHTHPEDPDYLEELNSNKVSFSFTK